VFLVLAFRFDLEIRTRQKVQILFVSGPWKPLICFDNHGALSFRFFVKTF